MNRYKVVSGGPRYGMSKPPTPCKFCEYMQDRDIYEVVYDGVLMVVGQEHCSEAPDYFLEAIEALCGEADRFYDSWSLRAGSGDHWYAYAEGL